jgi:hypothetical protein
MKELVYFMYGTSYWASSALQQLLLHTSPVSQADVVLWCAVPAVCSAGYGGATASQCALCDFGFYAAGGAPLANCTACPSGQTTPQNGSTSIAACSQCKPGFGGPDCTQCLDGTWSAGGRRDSTACTACATGVTTAANGSTSADDCTSKASGFLACFHLLAGSRCLSASSCQQTISKPSPYLTNSKFDGFVTTVHSLTHSLLTAWQSTCAEQCLLPCLCCPTAVLAGKYATTLSGARVTATADCPKGYYCPGAVPSKAVNFSAPPVDDDHIKTCPANTDTLSAGATSSAQCCKSSLLLSGLWLAS